MFYVEKTKLNGGRGKMDYEEMSEVCSIERDW